MGLQMRLKKIDRISLYNTKFNHLCEVQNKMTSTDHPIDKALDFLEAYLSQDFSLEELDDHAKKLHKEI